LRHPPAGLAAGDHHTLHRLAKGGIICTQIIVPSLLCFCQILDLLSKQLGFSELHVFTGNEGEGPGIQFFHSNRSRNMRIDRVLLNY
jgi:hypothetical protein